MPDNKLPERKHLRRLEEIYEQWRAPLFFITICVHQRASVLCNPAISAILVSSWQDASDVHGWRVGRYVIMPDHVHFFAAPSSEESKNLSGFVGGWKLRTQAKIRKEVAPSFTWQKEFFDHLLRRDENYEEKGEYVRYNPVRAQLVSRPEDWKFQGEIHSLEF